jgi:hypothetical protein
MKPRRKPHLIDGPLGAFFPVYMGEYLAWTAHLSTEEHGALLLLTIHHMSGQVLPDDDTALAKMAKMSRRRWRAMRPHIEDFFAIEDGEWFPTLDVFSLRERRSIAADLRMTIFKRDNFTCHYCGTRGERLECDHVIPVSRGGTDDIWNLVTACRPCNRSKGAKTIEEWLP